MVRKSYLKKICPKCFKEFYVKPSLARIVCCSISCSKRGHIPWNKGLHIYMGGKRFVKGRSPWNKGKLWSEKVKAKISQSKKGKLVGNAHWEWKGEQVGYRALHRWVENHLGKPDACKSCGKSNLFGRNIHWANKSREYKRDLEDWIRLCRGCHGEYDRNIYATI